MNAILKISSLILIIIAIWFCIADKSLSAQNILVSKLEIEKNYPIENNTHQNTFNFDEEENHFDKQIDILYPLYKVNSSTNNYILFNEQVLSTFAVTIWQPPKIS